MHVLVQSILVFMCMFMYLVSRIVNVMVVSSLPVRGSRTLQCGIRAHVTAWALMGHEESVIEASYPLPNREKNEKIREMKGKFQKKF